MIERDFHTLERLVEAHQQDLHREWQAAHAGPGPIRLAVGHRLVRMGEWIGGLHNECRQTHDDGAALVPSIQMLSR